MNEKSSLLDQLRIDRNAPADPGERRNPMPWALGGIMGLGALLGALNTMYAAVSARSGEIATLRAVGFGATPIVFSIFVEALFLALGGALVGVVIAWTAFDGFTHVGNQINLMVTPALAAGGIGLALAIASLGALFPAIRAARLPVATALQVR
jgi:putative ABC transport system permease protein